MLEIQAKFAVNGGNSPDDAGAQTLNSGPSGSATVVGMTGELVSSAFRGWMEQRLNRSYVVTRREDNSRQCCNCVVLRRKCPYLVRMLYL